MTETERGIAFRAADHGAITDNTGVTPDRTIANIAAVGATDAVGAETVSKADVPKLADVNARFQTCEDNIADLVDAINDLRANLRTAGLVS